MKLSFYKFSRPEEKENDELERKGFWIVEIFYRACVFMAFMVLCLFLLSTPKKGIVTFLDVGQGDGIFIRTDSGDVFMIDGGSSSKKEIGENVIVPYLKYEGEQEIDMWFLSHEDMDHVSGFSEVLECGEIKVNMLAVPYALKDKFKEITDLAETYDVEVVYLEAGDRIHEDGKKGYDFYITSPESKGTYVDSNAASMTILFQQNGLTAVFMADSGTDAEESMMKYIKEYGDGCVEILKCAHHGSAIGSNSEEFIQELSPDYAIISCGKNNRYGHPHRETLEYLEETGTVILRTDEKGAIEYE